MGIKGDPKDNFTSGGMRVRWAIKLAIEEKRI
jgi:hypothetical protein